MQDIIQKQSPKDVFSHELSSSANPALRATGLVNGNGKFDTQQPIAKNCYG